jgi:hypothetical protein
MRREIGGGNFTLIGEYSSTVKNREKECNYSYALSPKG